MDDGSALRAFASHELGHLTPRVEWVPTGQLLLRDDSVSLDATGTSICGNGWHHYMVVASTMWRYIALYIDGDRIALASWVGPRRVDGGTRPRGLWIAGEPPVTISGRMADATEKCNTTHAVKIAHVGLLTEAISPRELPTKLLRPTDILVELKGRLPEQIVMPPQSWWASPRAASTNAMIACATCKGRLNVSPASLWDSLYWPSRRTTHQSRIGINKIAEDLSLIIIPLAAMLFAIGLGLVGIRRLRCAASSRRNRRDDSNSSMYSF